MELKHIGTIFHLYGGELLIVPYGIETYSAGETGAGDGLLIVPYGIETGTDCV